MTSKLATSSSGPCGACKIIPVSIKVANFPFTPPNLTKLARQAATCSRCCWMGVLLLLDLLSLVHTSRHPRPLITLPVHLFDHQSVACYVAFLINCECMTHWLWVCAQKIKIRSAHTLLPAYGLWLIVDRVLAMAQQAKEVSEFLSVLQLQFNHCFAIANVLLVWSWRWNS